MAASGDADTHLPLRGVVLCCTSIEPEARTDLARWAAEMGAEHKLDLTSDVTHLIVGETQTPKYKYVAKEREDVKCLTEHWIPAVRNVWMDGGDVPLKQLEDEHRLSTFHQLKICITGFEDPDQRKEIEIQITTHGGEYRGDLRKDCTHLICFSPAGAKYTSAKAWGNISTISIEWLTMSIERGMVLDEQYFDPVLLPEQRGKDAWKRMERKSPSLKRSGTDEIRPGNARKLRRTASSKFSTDAVWNDLIPTDIVKVEPPAVLRRTESEPPRTESLPTAAARASGVSDATKAPHGLTNSTHTAVAKSDPRRGVFYGKRFFLHGFDDRRIKLLQQHLESQDGEVMSDSTQLSQASESPEPGSSFTIVPHTSSPEEVGSSPDLEVNTLVNELWVEKCLHQKAFVQPQWSPAHKPFKHPLAGFEKLTISSTGFEGVDLMHIAKIVNLLGANYSEGLTATTSLLLCRDESLLRQKVKHAIVWRIPVVKTAWLWDCLRLGQFKAWDEYFKHPRAQELSLAAKSMAASKPDAQDSAKTGGKRQLLGRRLPPAVELDTKGKDGTDSEGGASTRPHCETQSTTVNFMRVQEEHGPVSLRHSRPLHEMSPNLQHPAGSTEKGSSTLAKQGDQSLMTSLHSLLAKSREQKSQQSSESRERTPRKERQILGRARSDLSTRSTISRADSVNSVNTDGIGTPLEYVSAPSPSKPKPKPKPVAMDGHGAPFSAEMLLDSEQLEACSTDENDCPAPVMTQIGYDNTEALKRRVEIARKLTGSKADNAGTATACEEEGPRKLKEAKGTVSRRTRLNTK